MPSQPATRAAADLPLESCATERAAEAIRRGYDAYELAFLEITRRARDRFATRDWPGMQDDARERLALYGRMIAQVLDELHAVFPQAHRRADLWTDVRSVYAERIAGHGSAELAETFFNSVTRRALTTVGVNHDVEFVDFAFERVPPVIGGVGYRSYACNGSTADALRTMLAQYALGLDDGCLLHAAERIAARIEAAWSAGCASMRFDNLEMLEPVFYRRKGAYVVGRVRGGNRIMPLVLAFTHGHAGVQVDAVLLKESDVSIVFSFTRSYFHVDARRPSDVIQFLRTLMPLKPVAELYAGLGYNKHGKTELFRDLQRHLSRSDDRFVHAPGARGMVMAVFTLPSYDIVFKVIRDRFPEPKRTTRDAVRDQYRLVFMHDRAGRLVDANDFEHVVFDRERFSPALLDELLESCAESVRVDGDQVVIAHLYTERRVRPLDVYLKEADTAARIRVVLDYGQAIKDLAATNVFPGDLLLKNFGVTRHGRVVFYDYDELSLLEECRFRAIPPPRHPEDEMASEPWFHVGPADMFPEEFAKFLHMEPAEREAFLGTHGDLFEPGFWSGMQARLASGDIPDLAPYGPAARLGC